MLLVGLYEQRFLIEYFSDNTRQYRFAKRDCHHKFEIYLNISPISARSDFFYKRIAEACYSKEIDVMLFKKGFHFLSDFACKTKFDCKKHILIGIQYGFANFSDSTASIRRLTFFFPMRTAMFNSPDLFSIEFL